MKRIFGIVLIIIIIGVSVYYFMSDNKVIEPVSKSKPVAVKPLLKAGYSEDEIKIIEDNLSENEITVIEDLDYKPNLVTYIKSTNFCFNKLGRYEKYQTKDRSPDKVVMMVNMDLDYDFYGVVKTVDKFGIDSLINKYNKLSTSYKPNLVKVELTYAFKDISIDKTVYVNLKRMIEDAKKENLNIMVSGAYRTNQTQSDLYNGYVRQHGLERANLGSARPGHSEHQTGYAIDLRTQDKSYQEFGSTKEYTWVKNNLEDYGFIIRYPENKTNITGYMFEPWHIRYVGTEIANTIKTENITLEEFTVKYKKIEC